MKVLTVVFLSGLLLAGTASAEQVKEAMSGTCDYHSNPSRCMKELQELMAMSFKAGRAVGRCDYALKLSGDEELSRKMCDFSSAPVMEEMKTLFE